MPADEKELPGTKQVKCTLSLATIRYVEALSKTGLHGKGIAKVMTALIEQGVRDAIDRHYIQLIEDED